MPSRLQALFGSVPILCDGAMGTVLYERGVFINRCYDEINLTDPALIRSIHEEYLQAGAQLIEANTYGANRCRLQRFGLEDKLGAINQAGLQLAREAVAHLRDKQASEAHIAASLGPLGATLEPEHVRAVYAEQIAALMEGPAKPDLLLFETIASLAEAEQALLAARETAPGLPLVAMVTVDEEGVCLDGTHPEHAAARLAAWGVDGVGVNCSTGPAAVLRAIEAMAAGAHVPLFAMPNAGVPRAVEGRTLYLSSPEYMSSFARKYLRAGVQFIGGCCGTTPAHTRGMRSILRAQSAQRTAEVSITKPPRPFKGAVEPPPLETRSTIGRLLARGEFLTLVEIVPPRGTDTAKELAGAKLLAAAGVHAINIPDSPRASARMSAQSLCIQIQQHVQIETVLHYTCRDRNLLSIQSDLLGASSIGLRNILCLTGDPPKLGNYPDATAVFDVDAIGLTRVVRDLNRGIDIGGNPLGVSTGFTVAVAANPGVQDIEHELRRLARKVEAGAEYVITQPVFDLHLLEAFLQRIAEFRLPVIAGIWPLTSLRNAEFMRNDLRVAVPDEIMLRMARATEKSPDHARAEGIRIAQEMLAEARPMVQGVGASAPFGRYQTAIEALADVLPAPAEP